MRPPDQRIERDLAALREAADPLARVEAGRRLRRDAERLEGELVAAARTDGASWAKIGKLYGVSKQAAQQRFRTPGHPSDKHSPEALDARQALDR